MNSWYNNTLKNLLSSTITSCKDDVDWINSNRFSSNETQYVCLYLDNDNINHSFIPIITSYAFSKNIKIGIAYSQKVKIDKVINYNTNKPINQKFHFAVTEIEPYNTNDYAGMSNIITITYPKLKAAGMNHIIYVGWPNDSYWNTLIMNCDEINLHCYLTPENMNPNGIWGYLKKRLELIAAASKTQQKIIVVNIIYSCEPTYAFNWFKIHDWGDSHKIFMVHPANEYNENKKSVNL